MNFHWQPMIESEDINLWVDIFGSICWVAVKGTKKMINLSGSKVL